LSQAPDAGKRETAFRVFTTTPGIIEKQHEDAVAQAFAQAFKDDSVAVWILDYLFSFFQILSAADQIPRSVSLPWKPLPPSSAA
jgi:hypothetical protein